MGQFFKEIFGFLILVFLISPPLQADDYYDFDSQGRPRYEAPSARTLEEHEQFEFREIVNDRILDLIELTKVNSDLEEAARALQMQLRFANRYKMICWAGVCGLIGAGVGWLGFQSLVPHSTVLSTTSVSPTLISSFFAGIGIMIGSSLGAGIANAIASEFPSKSYTSYFSARLNQIAMANEEISNRVRAAAIPLAFWTENRLRYFMKHLGAFRALEFLILQDEIIAHSEIQAALHELGVLDHSEKERALDMTEAEIIAQKEAYLRRLRSKELATLKTVLTQLENPIFPKIPEHMTPQQCFAWLRSLNN